jgi:chromosome segregation ATPase
MAQEMSFAQALTEARQIIVQQSNRIKGDLDRIKTMQETIASQTSTIGESDRNLKQKSAELDSANDQTKTATAKSEEMRLAREQAEAVIDRQGQRLTQMQDTIANLEKQVAELTIEVGNARAQAPTQEDAEALAALAQLLSAKKGAPATRATGTEEATAAAA